MFDTGVDASEAVVLQSMPASGILSHFYVRLGGPASNKGQGAHTFVVRKNGKDTDVTCTIGVGGKDPDGLVGMDLEHQVEFKEGDTLSISCTPSDGPNATSMRWTARFE